VRDEEEGEKREEEPLEALSGSWRPSWKISAW
jgi:hypothetical protein